MRQHFLALLSAALMLTACDSYEIKTYDLGPAVINYPSTYSFSNVIADEDGSLHFVCATKHDEDLSQFEATIYPNMDLAADEDARRELLATMVKNGAEEYHKKVFELMEQNGEKGTVEVGEHEPFDASGCLDATTLNATYGGEDILVRVEARYIDNWKSVVYAVYETSAGLRDMESLKTILATMQLK